MAVEVYYSNQGVTQNINKYEIPENAKYARLPQEVINVQSQYHSIAFLMQFVNACWKCSMYFPQSTRFYVARLCRSAKKAVSSFRADLDSNAPLLSSVYLAEIEVIIADLEWYMLTSQQYATYISEIDGGITLSSNTIGLNALEQFEQWDVTQNIISYNNYAAPFVVDKKLYELISGTNFSYPQR